MATAERAASELQPLLRGSYRDPSAAEYEDARALYNAMIDKRPAGIAGYVDVADVIAAVRHARARDQRAAVCSGGHNGPGLGSVDGGLVIDLSPMPGVIVDPQSKTARVQAGARLGDVDHATSAFGLAVPAGIIPTTGVGGLTLSGGLGQITRRCGLTIDSLASAEVVPADGTPVTASPEQNEDLFWALPGGGGNFGIVISFTFPCHQVANVIAGPVLYDLDDAAELLAWWREFGSAQPDELRGFFAFLSVPPGPPFPEQLHLRKVCGVLWCYCGHERDPDCLREARAFGRPLLDGVQPMPLPTLQAAFDGIYPPGDQWYWRGDFVRERPDEGIERHVERGAALPSWKSTMHGEATRPTSMGGSYINFMMQEGQKRVQATYRGHYHRLIETKSDHDPQDFFRVNQNI